MWRCIDIEVEQELPIGTPEREWDLHQGRGRLNAGIREQGAGNVVAGREEGANMREGSGCRELARLQAPPCAGW